MTPEVWLRDVWMYSLQVGLLVGIAAGLAWALKYEASRAALAFWQALLIACVFLPLVQSWRHPVKNTSEILTSGGLTSTKALDPSPSPAETGSRAWPLQSIALAVLAAGIGLRLGWLVLGLWSLRRLRLTSSPIPEDLEPFQSARRRIGVEARFYSSTSMPTPVAFGFRRPVVLLPENVLALGREAQEAIAYHELLHVRRNDWIQLASEECVQALLWFHPAVWWLIERIHLTREQVVDRAVIELTESREHYVAALLAVAGFPPTPRLVPATLFLRKNRLLKRVNELFKETTMSRSRLLLSLAAGVVFLLSSALAGSRLFPLEARAAATGDPVSIEVKPGGAQLIHASPIEYPASALRKGVEGELQMELTVNEEGLVSDARVLSGPAELRAAALASALQWHFTSPGPTSGSAEAVVTFRLPKGDAPETKTFEYKGRAFSFEAGSGADEGSPRQKTERVMELLEKRLREQNLNSEDEASLKRQLNELKKIQGLSRIRETLEFKYEGPNSSAERTEREIKERLERLQDKTLSPEESAKLEHQVDELKLMMTKIHAEGAEKERLEGRLVQIRSERVPAETLRELMARLEIRVGDTIEASTMGRIVEGVRAFDEHLRVNFQRAENGGIVLVILAP